MIDLVVRNASQILTCFVDGARPPYSGPLQAAIGLTEGGVAVNDGRILDVGPGAADQEAEEVIDAEGGVVMPGFVDCHTHAVFVGSRADELEDRARGVAYEQIARRGGGIRASMRMLREASDDELAAAVQRHLDWFLRLGTTTIEAKSGYGLSLEHEMRSLRALVADHPVEVVRTCLAAHFVPPEFEEDREGYLDLVCNEILPSIAQEKLAEYCDVFCERGVFSFAESERVLRAGLEVGLTPRVHADQLSNTGGARLAARVDAITADHLEFSTRRDAHEMRDAGVIAVLLPAANYALDQVERPPTRPFVHVGVPIAIATDFNPGSAPTPSMPLVMNMAVTRFGLTIREAIVAATINAACAAGRGREIGALAPGRQADVIVCDTPDYRDLAYIFGRNPVKTVIKRGRVAWKR